ncbi:MAG: type II toxin-antitoxin system HicA family toxin [Candidatus Helarchaeota archaeon]
MTKLPVISAKKLVKILAAIGYYVRGQKGSHIHLRHPILPPLTIPNHKEIAKGTLRAILNQANLTIDEFLELLE